MKFFYVSQSSPGRHKLDKQLEGGKGKQEVDLFILLHTTLMDGPISIHFLYAP